jgi:hypothetical protein
MCELDRRSLLRAGAATVTVAPLMTFAPASAGDTRRVVFKGEFTDPTTPDWHYLPFRVPEGVSAIEVEYDHDPTDTGLGFSLNVVDIGIFDPSGHGLGDSRGFRGWSGGARRSFRITRHRATPGYIAGRLTPGRWHILLGPYQIAGQGTPYKVIVTLRFGRRKEPFTPTPAPQAVPDTGPGWYRGDLHLHTVHSDGKRTPRELVEAAQAAGLDFIGSSEHNTSSATYVWGRHVPDDFLVINGEEVTTRSGHWLAMGLPPMTWIDWRYRAEDDQLGRFTDEVRSLGGVAIAAHPFNPVPSIKWGHGYDYAGIDAIELWNGPWTGDDQTAVTHWHGLLVAGTFVPGVGNSDSHTESQTVGLPQTVYRLGSLSATEVVAAVKGGHAWLAESSTVDLEFTATLDETTVSCGDHLGAAAEDTATVRLTASGVDGSIARILGPVGVLGFGMADENGDVTIEVEVPVATAAFVRAEVGRPDGDVVTPDQGTPILAMAALTNPIFLT